MKTQSAQEMNVALLEQEGDCRVFAKSLDTPLGAMLAVANDDGLCLLEFADRRMLSTQLQRVRALFRCAIVPGEHEHLSSAQEQLEAYFARTLQQFTLPLALDGSEFQRAVWLQLLKIPFGQTLSYGALAAEVGSPDAQRAVGRANGDNRLAIVVPCHRVVRADGNLCGYGGGVWRKKWLLAHESGQRTIVEADVNA